MRQTERIDLAPRTARHGGATGPQRYWLINLLLMAIGVAWMLADPRFDETVRSVTASLASLFRGGIPGDASAAITGTGRRLALAALSIGVLASLLRLLTGIFVSAAAFRSVMALLVLTALIGAWLALARHRPEIAWQGQRLRLLSQMAPLEQIAEPLRAEWPSIDGHLPELGPFMAYPVGRPRTLILLTPPSVSPGTSISAIERTEDGSLLFQLTGLEEGAWVEWHAGAAAPTSFTGGLGDRRLLDDSLRLGRNWYLVRYEQA